MITLTITSKNPPFEKPWGNYLLENIIETPLPDKISWFPQTLGWKVLAGVIFLVLVNQLYLTYKNYKRNAYRRKALAWLEENRKLGDINFYQQLPALLRKTALHAYKRTEISQLSGEEWEHWLDEHCSRTNFTSYCPNALHQLTFKPQSSVVSPSAQYQELLEQITLWIKFHRCSDA